MVEADHVRCTYCEKEMYVPLGEEKCLSCGKEGCLVWVDEEEPEKDVDWYGVID